MLAGPRRAPAGGEEEGGATPAGADGDGQAGGPRDPVEPERGIERPPARAGGAQGHARPQEDVDILPALTGPEDEEAVGAVVGDEGHRHRAHDAGRAERGEQAGHQGRPRRQLGQAGQPGVHGAGPHAQRLEPAGGPGDAPAPEDVVPAVGGDGGPDDHTEDEQAGVEAGGVVDAVDGRHQPPVPVSWARLIRRAT